MALQYPLLPEYFLHWTDVPDARGEDVLRIVSARRSLTLKGRSFRDFEREVIPLLNGNLSIEEVCNKVSGTFRREEVTAALEMLAAQGIVQERGPQSSPEGDGDLKTQLGWLSEMAPEGRNAQERLTGAHVVLFGAGIQGAVVARALARARVGRLTIVDPATVSQVDPYFSGAFRAADIGRNRAEVLCESLALPDVGIMLVNHDARPQETEGVADLIRDATLVLCCLDAGELRLALALNRACRKLEIPWIASSLEGPEVVVGPGFYDPKNGACYQCWRTREVLASAKPETRLALEQHLEEMATDLSAQRENLASAADIAGGLLGTEVIGWLTGAALPALDQRFLTIGVPGLRIEKHVVLRKPGCSACSGKKP